jgi:hypothetical protein
MSATILLIASALTCPQTSTPQSWTGATLQSDTTRTGVSYVGSGPAHLELNPAASVFKSTALGITDLTVFAAVGDFNKDGWDDFVGAGEGQAFVRIYQNYTSTNPAPNWSDPNAVRTPKFTGVRDLIPDAADTKWRPLVAGDFNGDGWDDVFVAIATQYARPSLAYIFTNKAVNDAAGKPQFNAAANAMAAPSTPASLGYQDWGGTNIIAYDWNGDRKLDVVEAAGENNGEIRVFLNQCTPAATGQPAAPALLKCTNTPTFKFTNVLITGLGFGTNAQGDLPVFNYRKIDNDAYPDLVVGAPDCCAGATTRLRYFPGLAGGGVDVANVKSITFSGAATGVLFADFSQDGKTDLIVSADNWNYAYDTLGGNADYWVNNGTANPFSSASTRLTAHNAPSIDYDTGFVFDYDHDPHNTPDVMLADGNHTTSFYVLANRNVSQFVGCGDVASGVMPLGTLSTSEMVVTAARIHPTQSLDGGTITWWLTNETPPNWVQATDCGDGTGDLCATFPRSAGREVQWKATMCSNATHTQTPTITSVDAKFVYTTATEHYRAGVITNDGVSYVGAFREPGDRGRFYAVNAELDTTYWDAAAKLDATADATRRIYTADKTTGARLAFEHTGATIDARLVSTLGASNAAQAISVVDWVRSARFGVGNQGIALSKLGAVETSTPAVLTKPNLPTWYVFADTTQRGKVDEFMNGESQRRGLVMFGSKDGMMHAVTTIPTDITSPLNGRESWAYVPPETAGGMVADYSASLGGTLNITAYPDGSPTLADVADATGALKTIAIIGGANGGKSVAALDVTHTVDPGSGVVNGPVPLWSHVPGGSAAGQSYSKVAVARVRIGAAQRFVAIAGTGLDFTDNTQPYQRGKEIEAYDALTGTLLWKFRMHCPLTSDITVFETDDDAEPGAPTIDGYVDRAVFADRCGYVYKVDPAKDLGGAYNGNAGFGALATDLAGTVQEYALFSTRLSSGALGAESPIAGTLGAQVEAETSRLVLFFGTGGLESQPASLQNEFYAVYADDGAIRSKIVGTCAGGHCEKFYGGVVVSKTQVLLTRTVDPLVGSGTCDRGTTKVEGIELGELDASGGFVTDFSNQTTSAVMGALYGDAGALYFATLSGDVVRIGAPRAADAGDDTAHGTGTGAQSAGWGTGTDIDTPMTLYGWRQVF